MAWHLELMTSAVLSPVLKDSKPSSSFPCQRSSRPIPRENSASFFLVSRPDGDAPGVKFKMKVPLLTSRSPLHCREQSSLDESHPSRHGDLGLSAVGRRGLGGEDCRRARRPLKLPTRRRDLALTTAAFPSWSLTQ